MYPKRQVRPLVNDLLEVAVMMVLFSVKRGSKSSCWLCLCKLVFVFFIYCIILSLVRNEGLFALTNEQNTVKFQSIETYNGIFVPELPHQVEIYNRASIGEYLWNHLIEGKKELMPDGIVKRGNKTVEGLNFTYKTGKREALSTSQNVVLVVDGSTIPNQKETESWVKSVLLSHTPMTLFLVLLGNNNCSNRWILPYLASNGGPISAVFIVGDSSIIDHKEIFPWPLGVAT